MGEDWDHYDDAYSELNDKISKEAKAEHKLQLLQKYYLLNYDALKSANKLLNEANYIADESPTGAFVLAYAVCEVAARALIIKPLIYGTVYNEELAEEITKSAMNSVRSHAWELATKLADKAIGIDISQIDYKEIDEEPIVVITPKSELDRLSKIRNRVVHNADFASERDANDCIFLASRLLEDVIPRILHALELALYDELIVYRSMIQFGGEHERTQRIAHWAEMDTLRKRST